MCHHLTWEEWQLLRDMERREDEEPRTVEVVEREVVEAETERDPERELVHA
jgi:negative regulator of sigma E activity